jgi:purine-binding chemotaxis protein CheW
MNMAASAVVEFCSVRVGGVFFGMPIRHIVEILGGVHPRPVPLAPAFVGGLAHYRGEVLTTVSLRQLLGMPRIEGPQDILVLESGGECFGLLVDAVGEVLTASTAELEETPSTLSEGTALLFAGACKLPGRLLVLLNPAELNPMRLSLTCGH